MANVIKHKRGSGSDPSASDLILGELAIRTDTGKLFTKMDSGAIAEIAGGGSDIVINTLSSSSGTGGGSATFNGSAYRFTLSAPPNISAAQLLVSINGVIQKPVAGTGQPSEGFSVDGTDIILGDAPAAGSDFFILTFKSLGVSEPADNSVTSAKIVDGAITGTDLATNVDLVNNQKIRFGANNELQIFRSGTESLILENQGNNLNLAANRIALLRADRHTVMLLAIANGGVEIYHNNSKKFETLSDGAKVTGSLTATNNINNESDTGKLMLGASNDLQLYHDGTHSYVDNTSGSGNLYLKDEVVRVRAATSFAVDNADGTETSLMATLNGAVELYYDNAKRIETAQYGVDITGNLFMPDSSSGNTGRIKLGDGADLQIFHTGSNSFILDGGTGGLYIRGSQVNIQNASGTENKARFLTDGAVELYYDSVKRIETTSTGATVIGTLISDSFSVGDSEKVKLGNSDDLQIQHSGNHAFIDNLTGNIYIRNDGSNDDSEIHIMARNDEESIVCHDDGAVDLYHDGTKKFETTATGVEITSTTDATLKINNTAGSSISTLTLANTGSTNCHFKNENSTLTIGHTDEVSIKTIDNDAVELYHNNNKKLETTSTGVTVTGNVVIPSGNGINFNATADGGNGTARSELLDDYEEGSWTFGLTGGGGSQNFTTAAKYTKIGRMVHLYWARNVNRSNVGSSGDMVVNTNSFSLPFTPIAGTRVAYNFPHRYVNWASEVDGKGLVFELYNSTLHLGIAGDTNSYNSPIQQNATLASGGATSIPMSLSLTYYTDA